MDCLRKVANSAILAVIMVGWMRDNLGERNKNRLSEEGGENHNAARNGGGRLVDSDSDSDDDDL